MSTIQTTTVRNAVPSLTAFALVLSLTLAACGGGETSASPASPATGSPPGMGSGPAPGD